MTQRRSRTEYTNVKSGFDYESAYSDAEKVTLDSRTELDRRRKEEKESPKERVRRQKEERRRKKRKKKIILIGAIAAVIICAAIVLLIVRPWSEHKNEEEEEAVLNVSQQSVSVTEIYTYGTHLNLTGTFPSEVDPVYAEDNADLVLYNGEEFITVPITIADDTFTLSEKTNDGLYLDGLKRGTYQIFLRVAYEEEMSTEDDGSAESETTESAAETQTSKANTLNETKTALEKKKPDETESSTESAGTDADGDSIQSEPVQDKEVFYTYYALKNNTDYQETVYYTMSTVGNKIVIGNETEYSTMQMNVFTNTDDDVYDVVIDPARGGTDSGSAGINGSKEIDYLLPLALQLKADLEADGLKVALTRSSDSESLEIYGEDGRIARACASKAKYMVSLHVNSATSEKSSGLEIYAYAGMDYTLAQLLNENLQTQAGFGNTSTSGSIGSNIFCKMFTQSDIDEAKAENEAKGLVPYEPTTKSSYYYIVRETGGIAAGAFRDDRNPDELYNPYCYSNTGIETYVLELGFITNEGDVNILNTKQADIARAIADAFDSVRGEKQEEESSETESQS